MWELTLVGDFSHGPSLDGNGLVPWSCLGIFFSYNVFGFGFAFAADRTLMGGGEV